MSLWVRWGSRAVGALFPLLPVAAAAAGLSAYVVSSNDARVTRVDLDSGTVTPVATVGAIANRIEAWEPLSYALVVNSGSDDVSVLELATETVLGEVSLPAGSNPWTTEIVGARAFVSCVLTDLVYAIDPFAFAVVDSAPAGTAPQGMCVADGKLFVANTGFDFDDFSYAPGTVSVFDAGDLAPLATIPVGLNPQECLVAADGDVHVVCTGDFFQTEGSVHVIDPTTLAPVASLAIAGYPGGGATHAATAYLNVTTLSFGSELWAYDTSTLALVHDGSNPLLPSFDFYGNPRTDEEGRLFVPDFSTDVLLVETPADPGDPVGHLVGDGPIDLALVRRTGPVPIVLAGFSAVNGPEGILLSWRATVEADVASFRIERATGAAFETVADELPPAREARWIDRAVVEGRRYAYRVGAVGFRGGVTWSPVAEVTRDATARLAFRRVAPNPSRGEVMLRLDVPGDVAVAVEVVDVTGRRVARLPLPELPAGTATLVWDGRDDAGRLAGPGMYFAVARAGDDSATERILRLR